MDEIRATGDLVQGHNLIDSLAFWKEGVADLELLVEGP